VGGDMSVVLIVALLTAVLTLLMVRLLGRRALAEGGHDLVRQMAELQNGLASLLQEAREAREKIATTGQTAQFLWQAVGEVRESFARLQGLMEAREEERRALLRSVQRVEAIIAGSHGRGKAGERIVEELLAALPPQWQVRNHRVGTKVVEFAIRLPGGRLLPVDSKLPAEIVEEAASEENDDPEVQRRLQSEAEKLLRRRAGEVRQYLDPEF